MEDPQCALFITGLVTAFILSAFFSIIKVIFSSVERSVIEADDEHLRYYASKINDILKNRSKVSSTVVVGKTLSNIAFTLFAFNFHAIIFPQAQFIEQWVISIVFSFITLTLLGHYVPRAFAMRFYRSYITAAYYAYSLFSWFLTPFTLFFTGFNKFLLQLMKYDEKFAFLPEDDKARISSTDDDEALNEEEREMISSILDLSEISVDKIMVPRIDVIALDIDSDLQTVLKLIKNEGHSRIPVYKDTVDQITGILYTKDILSWLAEHKPEEWNLPLLVKKCHYVPIGKKINDLMKEFKLKHLHFAVIVDEYGGTAGIVTMEDILEEIVGDIQDEYDEEEKEIVQLDSKNVYLIDPHIDLHDLNEELDLNLDEEADYNTLSGLIYHEYGDIPQENTTFDYSGLRITILKMDNQRIEKVKIEVIQRPEKTSTEPF
ncbi:MAG: hemolysin family protein [Chitinispirillia bacterium]|nr:hemolysin family protein [Chitinispirillia bacterium]